MKNRAFIDRDVLCFRNVIEHYFKMNVKCKHFRLFFIIFHENGSNYKREREFFLGDNKTPTVGITLILPGSSCDNWT